MRSENCLRPKMTQTTEIAPAVFFFVRRNVSVCGCEAPVLVLLGIAINTFVHLSLPIRTLHNVHFIHKLRPFTSGTELWCGAKLVGKCNLATQYRRTILKRQRMKHTEYVQLAFYIPHWEVDSQSEWICIWVYAKNETIRCDPTDRMKESLIKVNDIATMCWTWFHSPIHGNFPISNKQLWWNQR